MEKVLIIGGGFGGLTVARLLSKAKLDITLIDLRTGADFLPTLPDTIGRGINPKFLTYKIEELSKRWGFNFINREVTALNLEARRVLAGQEQFSYDYLVIASGSETNFYNNENIRSNTFKLDGVDDARKIIRALNSKAYQNYIIGGGGYTGIEVATNLRRFLDKKGSEGKIAIVERAPGILGPLPQWMKDYVLDNLRRLKVDIFTNNSIAKTEGERVVLADGNIFENSLVIWAAGVKTAGFIQDLKVEKNPQGRIKVDEYLRLNGSCFAIGDAANFADKGVFLRMAVQFAISEGECAAKNILYSIKGTPLKKFQPRDLGYIIPMANNRSCGTVFGFNLKGKFPTLMHFVMCIYRSWGLKNKFGIIVNLINGGV